MVASANARFRPASATVAAVSACIASAVSVAGSALTEGHRQREMALQDAAECIEGPELGGSKEGCLHSGYTLLWKC